MKKLFSLILIALFMIDFVFADEYVISKIECVDAENYHDRQLSFKYDDEDDVYYIYRSTYSRSYWFTLTTDKLNQLRKNIKKIQDWSKLAKENRSSIGKEVPDSLIKVEGTMKSGNDWYSTRWDIPLNFIFVSSFSDKSEITSFMIRGGEQESRQNEFIDIEFESVLFINDYIDKFAEAINEETVEKAKKKHADEKKQEDLFN